MRGGRLFTLPVAISLAMGVATTAMWVRSYWTTDLAYWGQPQPNWSAWSMNGRAGVDNSPDTKRADRAQINHRLKVIDANRLLWGGGSRALPKNEEDRARQDAEDDRRRTARYRAELARIGPPPPTPTRHRYTVAYPWLVAAFAILPAVRAWQRFRPDARRGSSKALCVACGYDLRATLDRCPECGAVPIGTS